MEITTDQAMEDDAQYFSSTLLHEYYTCCLCESYNVVAHKCELGNVIGLNFIECMNIFRKYYSIEVFMNLNREVADLELHDMVRV